MNKSRRDKKLRMESKGAADIKSFLGGVDLVATRKLDRPASLEEQRLFQVEYEISKMPIDNSLSEIADAQDRALYHQAYDLCKMWPDLAAEKFSDLHQKYPGSALIRNNWLAAKSMAGVKVDYEKELKKTLHDHPNYLFAKTNYAKFLIKSSRWEEVPTVFHHKYNLQDLYPERRVFHISGHLSFYCIWGNYFIESGRFSCAVNCYNQIPREFEDEREVFELHLKIRNHPLILDALQTLIGGRSPQQSPQ